MTTTPTVTADDGFVRLDGSDELERFEIAHGNRALVAGPGRADSLESALARTIGRSVAYGAVGGVMVAVVLGALFAFVLSDAAGSAAVPTGMAIAAKAAFFGGIPGGALMGAITAVARWEHLFFATTPSRPEHGWIAAVR
ncbi:MAG: hypothetical protein AAGD18_03370 [Actinomycetota bacterium]